MLGGAVGDALGAPVEFMSIGRIRSKFGSNGITQYAEAYGRLGAITDDTQMLLFTLEGMLNACNSNQNPAPYQEEVRLSYLRWLGTQGTVSINNTLSSIYTGWLWTEKTLHSNRAPGNACLSSLRTHLSRMENGDFGIQETPINDSKGCGGVMRMAPIGFFDIDCFSIGCDLAKLTHGHPSGYLASGFLAHLIRELISGNTLIDTITSAREQLIQRDSHKEVLQAVDMAVKYAGCREATPETIEEIGGGWVAEEALAISLFCSLKAEDFAQGVRLAVNHGGDSDSTGAITGNILGTMWGRQAIGQEFLQDLEFKSVIEQMALAVANISNPNEWNGRYNTINNLAVKIQPESKPVPYKRSYWVNDGVLLAGCYPGDINPDVANQKLSSLLDADIRTTVSLMEELETDHNGNLFSGYAKTLRILAEERGISIECVNMPIEDNDVPTHELMVKILDYIDASIENGSPVYVHCWGGYGRTGTVVGCWLARHGIATGNDALERINYLRRNDITACLPSPQTHTQCAFVRSWKVGE
jgi:ADP-ribosylglycohydrolase